MDNSPTAGPIAVRSTLLRSVLLMELDAAAGRILSVRELCAGLERRGFTVRGRPSKVVSDALRVELCEGRVYRPSRGHYRIGRLPRTTRWRCRQRVREALAGRAPATHLADGTRPELPGLPARLGRPTWIRTGATGADRKGSRGAVVARRRNTGDNTPPGATSPTSGPAGERSHEDGTRTAPGTTPARGPPT